MGGKIKERRIFVCVDVDPFFENIFDISTTSWWDREPSWAHHKSHSLTVSFTIENSSRNSITTTKLLLLYGKWYRVSSDSWRQASMWWQPAWRCRAMTTDIWVIFRCLAMKHCLRRIMEKENLFGWAKRRVVDNDEKTCVWEWKKSRNC